jgi:hypothetical protein
MPRTYYDNEEDAHFAAREQSKESSCGLFVEEDSNGFYVTAFGTVGNPSLYMAGFHWDEIDDE